MDLRGIAPSQTVSDHVYYSADERSAISTGSTMSAREVGFDALQLGFGRPIAIRHEQVAHLNYILNQI